MAQDSAFVDLIRRVRAGDEQASADLVRRYEPVIRVAVRARLNDSGLRRLFDSLDICQSILGNFFARAASGQFELDTPGHLVKLLVTMARNRLINHVAQQRTARRDHRRDQPTAADVVDPGPSPSEVLSGKELLQAVRSRLSSQEQKLAEQRSQGKAWPDIAAELGGTADGLRMSLNRALDRVAHELRLED